MSLFSNPTSLYSDKIGFYAKYRPAYPPEVLHFLRTELKLNALSAVADIGSGTGIFTRLLLESGCRVHGVEPNPEMRGIAEKSFVGNPRFHSVAATAESTALESSSMDMITAAQSFHWFDMTAARKEFVRLLKPGGQVVLVWNERRARGSPFLEDFEALLRTNVEDYAEVAACGERLGSGLAAFFRGSGCGERVFAIHQDLDLEGFVGRFLSSSFAPRPENPRFSKIIEALSDVYRRHAGDRGVRIEYDTRLIYGRLANSEKQES